MSADYFPFETVGNSWEFENVEGAKLLIRSSGKVIKGNRECFLIERNYSPEFWDKTSGELDRFEEEYYDFGGERILLIAQWLRYLELPLILGNRWTDTLYVEKSVYGEKVTRRMVSKGEVEAIETVEVQAGRFSQCYKIKVMRLRETLVNSSLLDSDTLLLNEWYAPNIGLVKFDENGDVFNLIRVTIRH